MTFGGIDPATFTSRAGHSTNSLKWKMNPLASQTKRGGPLFACRIPIMQKNATPDAKRKEKRNHRQKKDNGGKNETAAEKRNFFKNAHNNARYTRPVKSPITCTANLWGL